MNIQCSCCGARKKFRYTNGTVNKTISEGWASYGRALYCPTCSETWKERNDKELASDDNTIGLIESLYERNIDKRLKVQTCPICGFYQKLRKKLNCVECKRCKSCFCQK